MKTEVTNWDSEKGFGFISPDGGDKDLSLGMSSKSCTHRSRLQRSALLPPGSCISRRFHAGCLMYLNVVVGCAKTSAKVPYSLE